MSNPQDPFFLGATSPPEVVARVRVIDSTLVEKGTRLESGPVDIDRMELPQPRRQHISRSFSYPARIHREHVSCHTPRTSPILRQRQSDHTSSRNVHRAIESSSRSDVWTIGPSLLWHHPLTTLLHVVHDTLPLVWRAGQAPLRSSTRHLLPLAFILVKFMIGSLSAIWILAASILRAIRRRSAVHILQDCCAGDYEQDCQPRTQRTSRSDCHATAAVAPMAREAGRQAGHRVGTYISQTEPTRSNSDHPTNTPRHVPSEPVIPLRTAGLRRARQRQIQNSLERCRRDAPVASPREEDHSCPRDDFVGVIPSVSPTRPPTLRSPVSPVRTRFPLRVATTRGSTRSPRRTTPVRGVRNITPERPWDEDCAPDTAKSMQKMSLQLRELIKCGQEALSSTVSDVSDFSDDIDAGIATPDDLDGPGLEPKSLLSTIPTSQLTLLYDDLDAVKDDDVFWNTKAVGNMVDTPMPMTGVAFYDTSMILRRPSHACSDSNG